MDIGDEQAAHASGSGMVRHGGLNSRHDAHQYDSDFSFMTLAGHAGLISGAMRLYIGRQRNGHAAPPGAAMDLGIAGRKAIVCASSRGLARACAEALAEAGCEVVVNGRNPDTLKETAAAIAKASGVKVTPVAADVTTPEGQAALFAACPQPDILVNNADGPPPKSFREIDRAAMVAGVTANMIAPLEMIQRAAPGMMERGFGRIINITSASVKTPLTGLDLSSGARAGLTAFLGGVAREIAGRNVTINNILPGIFETDRFTNANKRMAALKNLTPEEARAMRIANVPAHRIGTPHEFAQLCAFLCSVQAGYLVGQNFVIDGGAFASNF
jgi:3-oxoacyl-[acyl-carrier protein] reductase